MEKVWSGRRFDDNNAIQNFILVKIIYNIVKSFEGYT